MGENWWVWLMFFIGVALLGFCIATMICEVVEECRADEKLVLMGYLLGDLDAFYKVSDLRGSDLLNSEAARKVFQAFLRGELRTVKKTNTQTTVVPVVISN